MKNVLTVCATMSAVAIVSRAEWAGALFALVTIGFSLVGLWFAGMETNTEGK